MWIIKHHRDPVLSLTVFEWIEGNAPKIRQAWKNPKICNISVKPIGKIRTCLERTENENFL